MDILTKTFRAPNMLLALQQVQRELGSDAIVVSMRKVPNGPAWQVWREPVVEVIAMKNAGQNAALPAENKKTSTTKSAVKKAKTPVAAVEQDISEKPDTDKKPAGKQSGSNISSILSQYQAQTQPIALEEEEDDFEIPADTKDEVIISIDENADLKQEIRKIINSLTSAPKNETASAKIHSDIPAPVAQHWKPFVPPRVDRKDNESVQVKEYQTSDVSSKMEVLNNFEAAQKEIAIVPVLPKKLADVRDQLMEQELEPEFVNQMISTCQDILPQKAINDSTRIRTLLQRQFEAEIRTLAPAESFSTKNIFFIGNSGAGKTSSCAKMAAYAIQTLNKSISWVCADTIRTSAISEARTFTDLLNIPLQIAYTPDDLNQVINSDNSSDFVMIDTINCNSRSEASIVEVGDFITQTTSRSTFLVISATTKPVDLKQVLAAFRPFRIKGLIITKLDESLTFGNIYNLAWQSQVPICFYSSGTHVLNDLLPATPHELVDSLFGEGFAK